MKLLWFNWRCIKNSLAGGAETYTHEVARRLAASGFEVTLVTSKPSPLPSMEFISGYRVIRVGGRYTVYLRAKGVYKRLKVKGWNPDLVIDEVNTVPFFTPFYVEEPIIVLIHQLCKECWGYWLHPLAEKPGWLLEKFFHRIYVKAARKGKVNAVITVSRSTKEDLLKLGYPERLIRIVPNGVDHNVYSHTNRSRSSNPTVGYVGRIVPYKRIEHLIKAFSYLKQELPDAELIVAGRPDLRYLKKLEGYARRLGVNVRFRVNVSLAEKLDILSSCWLMAYTSVREGWGISVLEANLCGTPVVAYDVPGLRDSIIDGETGLLVKPGDIEGLAHALTVLLKDEKLRSSFSIKALNYSRRFDWDATAERFLKVLESYT